MNQSAKKDRAAWLNRLAASGDWQAMKTIRGGRPKQQGRLRNSLGQVVSSEMRAETLADQLESVQWKVRPATLAPGFDPPLRGSLPVRTTPFTDGEFRRAIRKMKSGKASQDGDIPVECFKALAAEPGAALQWILAYCNASWDAKAVPEEWRTASVSLIFKKGDPAECDNYRPISLIVVAEKLFA